VGGVHHQISLRPGKGYSRDGQGGKKIVPLDATLGKKKKSEDNGKKVQKTKKTGGRAAKLSSPRLRGRSAGRLGSRQDYKGGRYQGGGKKFFGGIPCRRGVNSVKIKKGGGGRRLDAGGGEGGLSFLRGTYFVCRKVLSPGGGKKD